MSDIPNNTWNTPGAGTGNTTAGSGGSMGGGSTPGSSNAGTTGAGGAFGASSATDAGTCAHCGQSLNRGGLDQFLARLGITEEMINNLKNQFGNVDVDEYMNTARDYLKSAADKSTTYTKENPAKVAAGVAALALGAGLLYAATHRDK